MAQRHPSAIKRHRQSLKRRARNKTIVSRVRSNVRSLREAIAQGNKQAATDQLGGAIRELTKAVTKGVFHRNAASRRVSRLSKQVHALSKGTSAPAS